MIGIVLVTHGRLAAEFRAALEHVAGPQKQIESIAIGPDDYIEQRRQDIVSAVTKVDSGAGHAHRYVRRHALQSRDFDYERLQY
jgi:mannose PTS system EIIA component